MSTGKRRIDHTAQEESEVTPTAPKFGDSGDEYKRADEKIHQRILQMQVFGLPPADLRVYALRIIYCQAASDRRIEAAPEIGWCAGLVESDPDFSKVLQNAIDEGHYKDVMSLVITRYIADHTSDQKQPGRSAEGYVKSPTTTGTAQLAWSEPYRGSCHEILLKNINAMERQADYATSVAIIQSSGTGKSRMVDEQANLVFTIPFNLRDPKDQITGAYPPEDTEVINYLCNKPELASTQVALDRTTLFFGHLFLQVVKELRHVFPADKKISPNCLARRWRTYLSEGQKRSQLYKNVVEACSTDCLGNYSTRLYAESQSRVLLSALATFCQYPKSNDVKVMLYFDEAHEFNYPIPGDTDGKKKYDVVQSSLNYFGHSFFTIFLSTQSSLTLLAPTAAAARSARQQETKKLNAPITETPFDCHPSFPLRRGEFKLEELGNLRFLARFGRPLFWTMLKQAEDDGVVDRAMELARKKLVFDDDIYKVKHSETAMLAILDVLITIDFEPRRDTAHKTEMDMVASHMRTAFSVPDHRLYIRSGYPSEPFLAEAASRQMYLYMRDSPNTMISILKNNLDHGLIDLGQRGEVVMRVLLRKAYMEAIVAEQGSQGPQPNFSKGCSFLQFLKALFADRYHDRILKATPENGVEEHTLEDALKDAVVRFTHFVKAVGDSVVETTAMELGFVRGSAFICHNRQKDVDIIIPVLLDKDDTVAESSMSALLIQVKRRKKAGSTNAYTIDQKTLDFFPGHSTTQKSSRPYVTLLAELGVDVTSKSDIDILDVSQSARRTPSRLETKRPAEHPKYSLRAKGCTNRTWEVINSTEHADYIQALGRDDLLDDHPRQNEESLQLVHQMLPFWYDDAAWVSEHPERVDVGDGSELPEEPMDEDSDP